MSPGVPELMNHVEQAESSPHAFTLNRNGRWAGFLARTQTHWRGTSHLFPGNVLKEPRHSSERPTINMYKTQLSILLTHISLLFINK